MIPVLALALAIQVQSNFDGGSIGRCDTVSSAHVRCEVEGERDQDGRNRQANWYFFRIDRTPGQLTVDLAGLPGEYNYQPNRGAVTADTPAVYSTDRKTWRHVERFEYDAAEPRIRLHVTAPKGRVWIAHTPPYTDRELDRLRRVNGLREETAGRTPQGRPIRLWTIGDGPRTVWLMFRQHSWESGSSWTGEGLVRYLLSEQGRELRAGATWKIFPMCDPDGVARGGVRFNHLGFDLNRNWDAIDAAKTPEIAAQHAAIAQWIRSGKSIDLFLSLHNTETSEYLDGPPEPVEIGARFERALEATSFAPSRPMRSSPSTTTAGRPGRMTVVQGLWRDFKVPAFLMEQRVAHNAKLGRRPLIEDRLRFGGELARAIYEALAR